MEKQRELEGAERGKVTFPTEETVVKIENKKQTDMVAVFFLVTRIE